MKKNDIVLIPVPREFANNMKIVASMQGISRLELARREAKKLRRAFDPLERTRNEENRFPFRY